METFSVQTVYHAAAYKHVPIVEHNLFEGIHNNVFGTMHTARAAIDAGVETFVLVSTDKAVSPTSVMGATKRFAELILQAHNSREMTPGFAWCALAMCWSRPGPWCRFFGSRFERVGRLR